MVDDDSSFEGIGREPTLPGNNTGEEAEPGTPGWPGRDRKYGPMARPTKGSVL